MLVGLIADTHGVFDPVAASVLRGVGLLLHAGDVGHHGGHAEVLSAYAKATCAPVLAVAGNVDDGTGAAELLPQHRVVQVAGWTLLLIHVVAPSPAAPVDATAALLIKQHAPDLVVFGHSHKAAHWQSEGVHFINPGSAGPARFKLKRTVATLQLQPKHSCEEQCLDITTVCSTRLQETCRDPTPPATPAAAASAQAEETHKAFPQQSAAAAASVHSTAGVQVTTRSSTRQQDRCCPSHNTSQEAPAGGISKGRRRWLLQHSPDTKLSSRAVQRRRATGLRDAGAVNQSDSIAAVLPCGVPPLAAGCEGQPTVGTAAGASRRTAARGCAVSHDHEVHARDQAHSVCSQAGLLRVYELSQKAPPRLGVRAGG